MIHPTQAMSALTRLVANTTNNEDSTFIQHDQSFNLLVSSTFKHVSETSMQYKSMINALSQSPHFTSDPKHLLMLQSYIGSYTNYISLVTSLTRKVVSTVETLEKSQ